MSEPPQSLQIPQTQVPSAASSSPLPRTQKANEADGWCEVTSLTSELRWPVPRRYAVVSATECSMSSYPVHRSLPPTRRSSSDEDLLPGKAQDKPLNPHANQPMLRATRIVSKRLHTSGQGF